MEKIMDIALQTCPQLCDNGICTHLEGIIKNGVYYISNSYLSRYCMVSEYHKCPIYVVPIDVEDKNYEQVC